MARGPRGLARSRCVEKLRGEERAFCITKSIHILRKSEPKVKNLRLLAMGKKCRFPRPPSGGFGKPHAPFADNDFSALPSRRLDRRARHNPTARHPVDERSQGAQRPTLSPRFARERKTKLPPAPNGDARLANDAAIGSRTSGRRSTPRFSHVKRRPARRDERPRAFVRAPRRRSVATPPRAPCSAGLATRGRPRARPIGRSVGRPLTPRCRGSTRSRSEARRRSARR